MSWTTQVPDVSDVNHASDYPTINASTGHMLETDVIEDGTSLSAKIAALSLLPIVIICGLFGNCLVCRAVFRYHKLRCVANSFIVSLAVSDLAVCGIIMPFAAYQELTNRKQWHLGPAICNIWVALDVLLCTASIWNLCVIALDRCMAITNPVWYVNRRTPLMAAVAISSAWGLSLLLSIMVLFLMGENFAGSTDYACQVSPSPAIAVVSASVTFYIPCIIVVALYIKIFIAARRHLRGKWIRAAISTLHSARPTSRCEKRPNKSSSSETHGNDHADPRCTPTEDSKEIVSNVPRNTVELQLCNVIPPTPSSSSKNCLKAISELKPPSNTIKPTCSVKQTSFTLNVPEPSFSPSDGFSGEETSDVNGVPKSARNSPPYSSSRASEISRPKCNRISVTRERRAAAVLAVVIGVFICCWLPFFIVYVIVGMCQSCRVTKITFQVLTWLGWCNSILNPLIYTIFNLDFRHAFRKILLDGPC